MQPIVIVFGTARDLADVINVQIFLSIGPGVSDLARVKVGVSHRKPQWPLLLCVALRCNTRDNNGPITLPCTTPTARLVGWDSAHATLVCWVRSFMKFAVLLSKLPVSKRLVC